MRARLMAILGATIKRWISPNVPVAFLAYIEMIDCRRIRPACRSYGSGRNRESF